MIRYSGRTPDVDLSEQVAVHLRQSPQRPTTLFAQSIVRTSRFASRIEVASDVRVRRRPVARRGPRCDAAVADDQAGVDWRDDSLFQRFHRMEVGRLSNGGRPASDHLSPSITEPGAASLQGTVLDGGPLPAALPKIRFEP